MHLTHGLVHTVQKALGVQDMCPLYTNAQTIRQKFGCFFVCVCLFVFGRGEGGWEGGGGRETVLVII